jgi:hypothetical protein
LVEFEGWEVTELVEVIKGEFFEELVDSGIIILDL